MPSHLWLVALFSVATAVAMAARWLRVPYTVALVLAGLILGPTHLVHPPELGQPLLYSLFLALSMVLAIALPREFPYRESIVAMTFGVVILSLFLQGLSIAKLLRLLDVEEPA